jgi:hypothetical protein
MPKCSRCQGTGVDVYDEDDRRVEDTCYHCAGSGHVDEELDFQDRLGCVATSLAYRAESEYRKACNEDPDGDGYDLGAYENQMMPFDYFRSRVWEREYDIMGQLCAMSAADQQFMVAWHEYPWEPPMPKQPKSEPKQVLAKVVSIFRDEITADDEIPF